MEKSSHVQVGYPKSDIDFHDVFGGPPRRSSMQDMQFVNSYVSDDDDEMNKWRSSWSGVREKPVFGDENVNRRRYTSDYFFDDIFKGQQQQPLSSPASRMLSPARPSPPQAEPLSPSSHPAQFSLPANLPKGVDLPAFGASALSSYKMINGTSIGTNPSSPNMSPPRFSGDVIDSHGELIDDVRSYRPSPLSHEISVSSEGSPTSMKSDKSDIGEKSKKDFDFGNMKNGSQFHFSIYKWASKGIPSMVPVRTGRSSRLKEKSKLERSSSFRNWILNKNLAAENPRDQSSTTVTKTSETDARSLECEKQQNELLPDASSENTVETQQMVQEADPLISKRVIMESTPSGGDSPGSSILKNAEQIEESDSLTEKVVSKKNEKEISAEVLKHESKTRHSLFHTKKDRQGISRKSSKTEVKEDKGKAKKKSSIVAAKPKNQDGKGCTQTTEEVDKSILEDSSIDKGDNGGMRKVKGKVKDFVKVFNQDASPNSKINTDSGSKSFRRTRKNTSKKEKESKVETSETDDKPCMPNGNSKSMSTGASIKVDEYLRESDNHHGATKTNDDILHYSSAGQKGSSVSNTATVPDMSDASVKVSEEYFSGNFQVNELHQAEDELLQKNKTQEETQAIDAKIRKWSNGKEGNIRSMLSTLQYVLWPESGWKPVPLVDIIEGNAVKKAYQKALLCLHPDKLQQKGAASHQKYTAEKVFDILQEAWNQFNSFNPL